MEYKKRRMRNKNKKNKRGGTYTFIPKNYGPGFNNGPFGQFGHDDPLGNENNTNKFVGKIVIGGAITAVGIWLLLKFRK
jgi:hypothetical protein